ncbi:MAG: WhiB family transcriptional regulator [Acidimicrobiales bacterium]
MRIDELHDWQALMRPGDPGLDLLLDAVRGRPPWMARAACRDHPEVDFLPSSPRRGIPADVAPALAICAVCPVTAQCLAAAVEHGESGVWGGTTERQRRLLRKAA